MDNSSILSFGVVVDILVFDVDNYYIVCEELITECFCHHLHAYEVSHHSQPSITARKVDQYLSLAILGLYKVQSTFLIFKLFNN